ncbi:apoptosis-inducing factor 1, mitochondrial-like isoform X2 [Varroa jacobsoni]|uniref:FAD/NAD(P)-binding domain-containing protein n=1 Tax=Varroa destructor TaxID=109461 RepID=A0A7M7JWV6_VARDE|nr:apoptosis-inducing factor 1, mitochondrial-like isoform X2 [Varroa destructor]XP_022697549.1 apoptosis-inducing factor 1, mitochondrial-like isoform X2 [Varroa jacobsoni]
MAILPVDKVQYLLVGGGASTYGAYRAIRAADPKAQVLIVGEDNHLPYMKPPLSKELWQGDTLNEKMAFKQWNGKERSIMFEHPEYFAKVEAIKESPGVAYMGGLKVVRIDAKKKIVYFADGNQLEYGRCLLAPGAKTKSHPILSKIPEITPYIVELRTIDSFKSLQKSALESKSIVIVGESPAASELAVNMVEFAKRANSKLEVIQIFPEAANMCSLLPEYLAKWLTRQISAEGVEVLSGTDIIGAEVTTNKQVRLILTSGKQIIVDRIVLAMGSEPNIEFAQKSGLEVDKKNGGIVVNSEFQVSTDLYAAGDACSFYDQLLGRRRMQSHDHGIGTGRIAGRNMAGGHKSYSKQSIMWCDVGNVVSFEGVGVLDPTLETYSVFFPEHPEEKPDFNGRITRGVVFYKNKNDIVVGILLCNTFARLSEAEKIIKEQKPLDLKDVAKVFYEKSRFNEPTEVQQILAESSKKDDAEKAKN